MIPHFGTADDFIRIFRKSQKITGELLINFEQFKYALVRVALSAKIDVKAEGLINEILGEIA